MLEPLSYAELACAEVWGGNGRIRKGVKLPGLDGVVLSEPCGGQGGDVYYVSACSAGLFTRVYLADVAGHGEEVASLGGWIHEILRRRMNLHDTGRVFADVNRRVIERGYRAYTTAACFTFDARSGAMNYCYAGHPPMLHLPSGGKEWRPLPLDLREGRLRNLPFGVDEETTYDVARCELRPGDSLLLYSDGLTETPDAERVLFGEERLLACLQKGPADDCATMIDGLMQALCGHAGKSSLDHDDVTVLAFRVQERERGFLPLVALRNRLRRRRLHKQQEAVMNYE